MVRYHYAICCASGLCAVVTSVLITACCLNIPFLWLFVFLQLSSSSSLCLNKRVHDHSYSPMALRSMQDPGLLQDPFTGVPVPRYLIWSSLTPIFFRPFFNFVQPSAFWFSNGPFSFWDILKHFFHLSFFRRSFHVS